MHSFGVKGFVDAYIARDMLEIAAKFKAVTAFDPGNTGKLIGPHERPAIGETEGGPESTEVLGDLGELRGLLSREAARVSGVTNRTLGDVVQEAASGAFALASLKSLGTADADKVDAALRKLRAMAVA
jgi:hypothetical protein